MNQNPRTIFDFLQHIISLNMLMKCTKRKIILPFYHSISDTKLPHIKNLYELRTVASFEADLDFLCTYYSPIKIEQLNSIIASEINSEKPIFHLTFDDGLKEFYTIVAPILEARKIPATVFINTDFIDNKNLFYRYKISLIIEKLEQLEEEKFLFDLNEILKNPIRNKKQLILYLLSLSYHDTLHIDELARVLKIDFDQYLKDNAPYMTTEQIEDLLKRGFTIGSHSIDHPLFNDIGMEEQKRQILQSLDTLVDTFSIEDKYFSFPFSDEGVTTELFDWIYTQTNCKLSFGVSGLKSEMWKTHLHRIPMESSNRTASAIIKSEYIYYMIKMLFNKNFIER